MKQIIVQFGGTGDLAKNKLLPAYFELCQKDYDFHVIALGRRYAERDEYIKKMVKDEHQKKAFLERISYIHYDMTKPDDNHKIADAIKAVAGKEKTEVTYYLALLPEFYDTAVGNIKQIDDLLGQKIQKKIVLEKPFGFDLASSEKYNAILNKEFSDEEIYRVDHYLGKEFVQNLLVMRFYNDIIQGIWNKDYIDHIQIIINETAGVDQRLGFYEKIGVVRDMVQNHILQIITHLTMAEPAEFSAEEISEEKIKVLKSIRAVDEFVLGKYDGLGKDADHEVNTPTFAALKLYVDNFEFSGVPIYVKTGKKQHCKCSSIYVKFKNFKTKTERKGHIDDNAMVITIQPEMSIDLLLNMKKPSETWRSESVKLNFNHANTFKVNTPEAYEKILEKILAGDKTLFPREEEINESWKIVAPLLAAKKIAVHKDGKAPLEAEKLIEKDGRQWFN
ncbi:MAG: glucose-6-phosphate dehydrogenase [Nanoarchaeota archaeon]